jgi:hypothetical protein
MLSKIWLTNLFLGVFVVFFGIRAYGVWSEGAKGPPPKISALQRLSPLPEKERPKVRIPPESDYEIVVTDNVLWWDRVELKDKKQEAKSEAKPEVEDRRLQRLKAEARKINLYGVIITGDKKKALITNVVEASPGRVKGRDPKKPTFGRQTKWVKIGDAIGEFKVKEIHNGRVKLTSSGQEFQISLYDKSKSHKRGAVKKKVGPVVVTAGSRVGTIKDLVGQKQKESIPKPKESSPKPNVLKKVQQPKSKGKAGKLPEKKLKRDIR